MVTHFLIKVHAFETPEGSAECYYIKNNKQCQELQFWAFK